MNVLLIRSDLPESPEVLLLAGLLASKTAMPWIPSPEVIVCKLIKLWAWVAEHGHRDSDSLDYWIPSPLVASLESQLGCRGLLDAMCDIRVDWCRYDDALSRMAFCRFAEWNGEDAMKKRGDSARARKSRLRSHSRMGIGVESVSKAHAKRDASHESRAPSIDVDVFINNSVLKTSTSTSEHTDNNAKEADYRKAFCLIRESLGSPHDATEDQVDKDRATAWKAAIVVIERIGVEWLLRVLGSAAKSKPRRPYAYLYAAIAKRLSDDELDANRLFAKIDVPSDLVDPESSIGRIVPRAKAAVAKAISENDEKRIAIRKALIAKGLRGDELLAAFDSACA